MSENLSCIVALVVLVLVVVAAVFAIVASGRRRREREERFKAAAGKLLSESATALRDLLAVGTLVGTTRFRYLVAETRLLQKLKELPENHLSDPETSKALTDFFARFGWQLASADPAEMAAFVVKLFSMRPDDSRSHEYALWILNTTRGSLPTNSSEWLYKSCLALLEDNPGSGACKRLALEVGRWHYGRLREQGSPTIYDEQAMQNDILVRAR